MPELLSTDGKHNVKTRHWKPDAAGQPTRAVGSL